MTNKSAKSDTANGNTAKATAPVENPTLEGGADRKVKLNTTRMKSSYCNVCNATSTREEVVVNFGLNQSWDRSGGDLEIDIEHRVILSPHAAAKLRDVLDELIGEYEGRYGPLSD